ncbi:PKD domain-containing protein [uncultured Fluviicola sp.]|uniref:PKD domain-containing protein n=1 Tax=uncultured Fluviicola sp. TaxID=463303 RepID=UPI0025D48887|nr:PKD domain-containing protein [uncultured Fluviicola sp.]
MKKILLSFFCFSVIYSCVYAQDSISVLFIGNSYTYVNDLPGTLGALAANLGKEITIDSKTNGGYTFQNHTTDPLTYSKIHSKPWDVVVIQGQSQEPSFPDAQVNSQTLPYAMQLSDSIWANNSCSNVMYYMTWGRQNGDPQWSEINTFEKMNTRLYNAYMRMADSSDHAMVSPVGRVWSYVRENHPAINLYNADQSHPSAEGTYLAACTFYTSLFRQSPVGATYYGGLSASTAGILQNAATTVILDSLDHFHLHPVDEPTQASFTLVQNGETIQLTNTSSRATTYTWDFGDGQSALTENAQHTFGSNGTYTVQLMASSICNTDTFSIQVQVMSLGLPETDFEKVVFLTHDEFIEVSAGVPGFSLEVFSVEGKLLMEKRKLGELPVMIHRTNQIQLFYITRPDGRIKTIRSI